MTISLKFSKRKSIETKWNSKKQPFLIWAYYYSPPFLFFIHLITIITMIKILFLFIFPTIRDTFLKEKMFRNLLCPDINLKIPFSNILAVNDFIANFQENLDKLINDSFMNLSYANNDTKYYMIINWTNGTVTDKMMNLNISMFYHLSNIRIGTSLNYIIIQKKNPGCMKWNINSDIALKKGSYSFHGEPVITQEPCSYEFMKEKSIDEVPQKQTLRKCSFDILVLSFISIIIVINNLVEGWKKQIRWSLTDSFYNDLEIVDQIHLSIGFWTPIHFIMNILLIILSFKLLRQSYIITQYISKRSINFYAYSFFITISVICRWLVYFPKLYQIILIIRVSFIRLLSIAIGYLPFICALMMFGLFLFGMVSDITFEYYRFFQMFIGIIFGDDEFGFYSDYSDKSILFEILSFIYCTLIGIFAGYAVNTGFLASIRKLREIDVFSIIQSEKLISNN